MKKAVLLFAVLALAGCADMQSTPSWSNAIKYRPQGDDHLYNVQMQRLNGNIELYIDNTPINIQGRGSEWTGAFYGVKYSGNCYTEKADKSADQRFVEAYQGMNYGQMSRYVCHIYANGEKAGVVAFPPVRVY